MSINRPGERNTRVNIINVLLCNNFGGKGVSLGYTLKEKQKWHIQIQFSFNTHLALVLSLYSQFVTFLPCFHQHGQKLRLRNRKVTKIVQIGNKTLIYCWFLAIKACFKEKPLKILRGFFHGSIDVLFLPVIAIYTATSPSGGIVRILNNPINNCC